MTLEASRLSAPARRLEQEAWGVLFCGGASRRMGRDKASLVVEGTRLIERALRALASVTPRVLLASGTEVRYPELGLECVLDSVPCWGPLAGLEAALERLAEVGVPRACVLACDMPRVSGAVLRALLARAQDEAAEVCLVSTGRGLEPLCGVYDVRALPAIRAARARGERRLNSFHASIRLATVPEIELAPGCALNLNTPMDLDALAEGSA